MPASLVTNPVYVTQCIPLLYDLLPIYSGPVHVPEYRSDLSICPLDRVTHPEKATRV